MTFLSPEEPEQKAAERKLRRVRVDDLVSISQVADRLQVPHQSVRYAIKTGRIPKDGIVEVDGQITILLWSRCKDLIFSKNRKRKKN